jgi:hypothetical protein
MSVQTRITKTVQAAGRTFSPAATILTAESQTLSNASVPAAKTGTLTTRTDNDTGELTMTTGHGITTGARLDLFWVTSGVAKRRYGMTVGTVATNAVPIDGGAGDNLPATSTTIYCSVPQKVAAAFVGNDLVQVVAKCDQSPTQVTFTESDGTTVLKNVHFTTDNAMYDWDSSSAATNPFAGVTAAFAYLSNGDPASAAVFDVAALYSST